MRTTETSSQSSATPATRCTLFETKDMMEEPDENPALIAAQCDSSIQSTAPTGTKPSFSIEDMLTLPAPQAIGEVLERIEKEIDDASVDSLRASMAIASRVKHLLEQKLYPHTVEAAQQQQAAQSDEVAQQLVLEKAHLKGKMKNFFTDACSFSRRFSLSLPDKPMAKSPAEVKGRRDGQERAASRFTTDNNNRANSQSGRDGTGVRRDDLSESGGYYQNTSNRPNPQGRASFEHPHRLDKQHNFNTNASPHGYASGAIRRLFKGRPKHRDSDSPSFNDTTTHSRSDTLRRQSESMPSGLGIAWSQSTTTPHRRGRPRGKKRKMSFDCNLY
jgi:hypothetical protein